MFLAVLIPAAATLLWLGVNLLEQDRLLFRQREAERQAAALRAIASSMSQSLAEAERRALEGTPTAGVVLVKQTATGIDAVPAKLVAWMPESSPLPNGPDEPFSAFEQQEFRGRASAALSGYRSLSHSPDPRVRAGALLRLARVFRNTGRLPDALAAYEQLAQVTGVALDGTPADLVARRAACEVLQQLGRRDALESAAAALEVDFRQSRWSLDRGTWELVADDLRRWTSRSVEFAPERLAFSAAIEGLTHSSWSGDAGRFVLAQGEPRITVLRHEVDGDHIALLIPAAVLERWLGVALRAFPARTLNVSIVDDRGVTIAGETVAARDSMRREPSDSGLPWGLVLAAEPDSVATKALRSRELLVGSALVALTLFLGAGTYVLWRAVQREVAIAHLQAEFVSAVSHEFRTPLTSMRHMVELLQEGDEEPRERRAAFYDVLARSTDRLHRLVESLLDFGRMEHARKPYDLRPVDLRVLVSAVIDEFRVDPASGGRVVSLSATPAFDAIVQVDTSAIGHAIWNLLDNAVKYSPGGEPVQVAVVPHPGGVAIAVTDNGLGIRAAEQHEIFEKFVRGGEAIRLGIKGTGVGLAIVRHIMTAHDGTIELESEEGRGSTFRIVLPALPA